MIVLSVHNHYQQRGGEAEVAADEAALLEARGHRVVRHAEDNERIRSMSRVRVAFRAVWSPEGYARIRARLREVRPDVMHVHNFFPLLSPSIYYAARAEGVPVVQTLHNYRLLCANAQFYRNGEVCEDCLGRAIPHPGIRHGCYRGSRSGSAAVAGMVAAHRAAGTWTKMVEVYLALTEFGRRKLVEGGLPPARVMVKPNFVDPDPGVREGPRKHALFIGRFSEEKGIPVLLDAWETDATLPPLYLVGDGPLRSRVETAIREKGLEERVRLTGRLPMDQVMELLHGARFLAFPSRWYEGQPRVIVEAFACGVPVVASDLGASAEMVRDGENGFRFRPGDAGDLARVARALEDDGEARALGRGARREFEERYTADVTYPLLLRAYETAMDRAPEPSPPAWAVHGPCA